MIAQQQHFLTYKVDKSAMTPQKITQMQCEQTNSQLRSIFLNWICQSCKYFPHFVSSLYPELQALVGFCQYRFSIAINQPQPGDHLQNLKFKKMAKIQSLLWLLMNVIVPYFRKKYQQLGDSSGRIINIMRSMQKIYTLLQFLNLAIFILKGKYRTIVQRVLSIEMEFIEQDSARVLNFDLMNRMLLWKIYEMFLKTVLPSAFKLLGSALKNVFYLSSYLEAEADYKSCVVCQNEEPVMPVKAEPCSHRFCYYCKYSKQHKQNETCDKCGKQILKIVKLFE